LKKKLKEGQLAFLPSDLTLLQFATSDPDATVQKFYKTLTPSHVHVVEYKKETPYCVVLYNGERWSALKTDVYPTERLNHDH